MQKKLLAVAVLSAFSGVAAAQSANVTLYGTIVQNVEQVSATGGDGSSALAGDITVQDACQRSQDDIVSLLE